MILRHLQARTRGVHSETPCSDKLMCCAAYYVAKCKYRGSKVQIKYMPIVLATPDKMGS